MPDVHLTALVDPAAELEEGVIVGPYAIVEAGVHLGARVRIEAHAHILRGTNIGAGTVIGRGSIIGEAPQDRSFDLSLPTGVVLGARNIVREYVTIHRATRAGENTCVGDDNYLMTGVHLAHDVVLGNHNMLANNVLLAGHVKVGSHVVIGGGAVFHQFMRIGDGCMVQGRSAFSKDIPPYLMAARINRLYGLNVVGLRRNGVPPASRAELKRLMKLLWLSGKNLSQAMEEAAQISWSGPAAQLIAFLQAPTIKGVAAFHRGDAEME